MSAFRRSTAQETKPKTGKGGKGNYYERLNIPKGVSTPIILIQGNYQDLNPPAELQEVDPATGQPKPVFNAFHKFKNHKRKLMMNGKEEYRSTPCSAGPNPHNPQPCAGCMAMDQGDKSVTLADTYLFGVVHLNLYHNHPLIDKNSRQVVMKQDNSGPVMVFSECSGRTCNFCRVRRGEAPIVGNEGWPGFHPNQFNDTFGHRRYLEIGKGHLENLTGFDTTITSLCANPQCGGQLSIDGYDCPYCHTRIIDMTTDPRGDQEIFGAVARPYPCVTCQRAVLLKEESSCEACYNTGRQFRQTSLFENVLHLFKQGEGTKSQIMMQRYQSLESFAQQVPPALLGGKTLLQTVSELAVPYDFANMSVCKPLALNDQAQRLSLQVGGPQQSVYGQAPQYGAPPPMQPQYGAPQQQWAPQPQQPQYPTPMPPNQQGFIPPHLTGYQPNPPQTMAPQQPAFVAYPPAPQPNNHVGPAPFQPVGRPNFGS